MMGSSPPSQSTLSDLKVLLELLQAASDPKKAKAAIDSIADARKQYDDAITESNARQVAAQNAEANAATAQAKAEAAEAKLDKKMAALDAKAADVNDAAAALAQDRSDFEVYKAEIAEQAQRLVAERAQMNAGATAQVKAIAADRTELERQLAAFADKVQEVADLKADYEAKLAKIKALTE